MDSKLDKIIPEVAHKALWKRSKEFGDQGKDAITEEPWQVHMQNMFSLRKLE